jgi:hypothetical protein
MPIFRACAVILALCPSTAAGQMPARTFTDLLTMLAPRDRVIVIDVTGRETMGPVETIAADAFTMAVTVKTPTGSVTGTERRTFRDPDVKSVRRMTADWMPGLVIYPATWERVNVLPAGSLVRVSFLDGKTESYRFGTASADALTLTTPSGQSQTISKRSITRVVRDQHRDGVGNGIAIGALIGAGTMAVVTTVAYATCNDTCDAPSPGLFYLSSTAFGAGIGAAAGWLIDYLHKGSDVVFPVAAVIAPGVKALYIARRF